MSTQKMDICSNKKKGKEKKDKSKSRFKNEQRQLINHPIRDDIEKYYAITDRVLGMFVFTNFTVNE